MKRLSLTRILCVLRLAPHLSVLFPTNPPFCLLPCPPDNINLSQPTPFPHTPMCALPYGMVWAHLNTAPSPIEFA